MKQIIGRRWTYLPIVFSSVTILATQLNATPNVNRGYDHGNAKQVSSINHNYVGGNTQIGVGVTDKGNVSVDVNQVLSESSNASTSAGLWGDFDLQGDDKGIQGRGAQLNHNWVSRDAAGQATFVNKVTAAYDRNKAGHDKATLGYGQEDKDLFWEGHVSKNISNKVQTKELDDGRTVATKAYDYGVGGSVGTFIADSNLRIRAGLDHEWGDAVSSDEKKAKNTTLSAGIEKFFQDTAHSLGFNVAASRKSGGYGTENKKTDVTGNVSYRYDFGGASIYQPDKRYRRVRVEIPNQAPRMEARQQYKRVATYESVPVYATKTVKKPFKQLVKSTMGLEGQTFFKLNSAKLIPSAKDRLSQIASEIRSNGYKGSIRITGNTCGLGDPVYDQRLSEQRANAVRRYLIDNGFSANDLIARGLGKGHPKYPNTPSEGFKNRRVDIEYVSESNVMQTRYRTEQKTVQTGVRQVVTGFKHVPNGTKNVMVDSGRQGEPRVIWKTELIPTAPAWIKRALHNNIRHNKQVNTYETAQSYPETPTKIPPRANPDTRVESCSTDPMTINVLDNDKDPDGDNNSLWINRIIGNPAHGEAYISADGQSIIYTPDGSGCGETDTFAYEVSDETDQTAQADVSIQLTNESDNGDSNTSEPCNAGCTFANDDYTSTFAGDPVMIEVLGNDEGDFGLNISAVDEPKHGSTVIVGDQIRYTPNSGFTGEDSFWYDVTDDNGYKVAAKVFVTVEADQYVPE